VARRFLGFGGQGGTFLRGSDDDHQPAGTVGVFLPWEVGGSFAIGQLLKGSCRRPEGEVKIVFVPLVGCSRAYFHIRELTLNPTAMLTLKAFARIAAC
jgi:hypothetical protein